MALFLLTHRHAPRECGAAAAAWHGHESPLRGARAVASCVFGTHEVRWLTEADDGPSALALLPPYVAERSQVEPVRRWRTP